MLRALLEKFRKEDVKAPSLTLVPFAEAAQAWLDTRKAYISPTTYRDYGIYIKTLGKFFGELRLSEIDSDLIRKYQEMRSAQVGASAVNHETSVLQQMLKRIRKWETIAGDFEPMPLPKTMRGRALSDEEYERLFRLAASRKEWEAAFLFAQLSVNTTAGPKEVRTLRLSDVDLSGKTISIHEGGAKNAYRIRIIPLNDMAYEAALKAVSRANVLGSKRGEHHLFPFRIHKGQYDPAKCQTSFKTAWRALTAEAQLPGFRMYDLRHHSISALLECEETSEETVISIAGHVSRQMLRRYAHIRLQAKRQAVEAMLRHRKKV